MKEAILRKARESAEVKVRFFEDNAERLEGCVRAMTDRFGRGGRLWVAGNGGSACDAQHVAVEFLHPIIEKRRPLPAQALSVDTATLTAVANDHDYSRVFVEQLETLARPEDMLLGISSSGASSNVNGALRWARDQGLLTIGFSGRDGGPMERLCEYPFVVRTWSIHRVQETQTALLHLLWDQLHVALGEQDVL
jgi:D-sedoheptulose 7-phosphate isomerase